LEQLLINELSDKEALELTSEEQWFSLTVEGEAVLVEVGESPARPFEQFRMEFRRGDEVVVEVEAKDGVALLTLEHFQMVQQKQADRLVILKLT
jgi:tRNA threonylcarbamoyladenosine modification (KEOPS) complex  Pcc1 subunit